MPILIAPEGLPNPTVNQVRAEQTAAKASPQSPRFPRRTRVRPKRANNLRLSSSPTSPSGVVCTTTVANEIADSRRKCLI